MDKILGPAHPHVVKAKIKSVNVRQKQNGVVTSYDEKATNINDSISNDYFNMSVRKHNRTCVFLTVYVVVLVFYCFSMVCLGFLQGKYFFQCMCL